MAGKSAPWGLVCRSGIWAVRFTWAGHRWDVSTREKDRGRASQSAAKIYSDVISGKLTKPVASRTAVGRDVDLLDLAALWIDAITPELGERTPSTYQMYTGHWLRHMTTLADLTTANAADYLRHRLREVQAETVRKEMSALRRFSRWLAEQGYLTEAPKIPGVPKKAVGTARASSRPQAAELSQEEVQALLAALPGVSRGVPVRAWCTFAYETGLRPSTINRLTWADVTAFGLHIRRALDKNRWERTVPLSPAARAALESLPRLGELIFPSHDFRDSFRQTVERVLPKERWSGVTPYALKHNRITHWFEGGADVASVSYLTGIKQLATLARYMRASRKSAERLVGGVVVSGPSKAVEGV